MNKAESLVEGEENKAPEISHTIIDAVDNTVRLSIKKGFEAANKLSPTAILEKGAKVFKYAGRALGAAGILLSTYQGLNNPKGWQLSNTIDVVVGVSAFIPVAGEFIGIGWFIGDLTSKLVSGKS